ncbi:MAG: Mth938-like domain-containing protein [Bacteroidales bacterium]
MIEEYKFGKMVIDGETYDKDLIITKDGVLSNWWRDKGHRLQLKDIKNVLEDKKPEMLIVGTGKFGMMKISDEVKDYLQKEQIELYEKESGKSTQEFNKQYHAGRNVVGAFHLTC